MLLIYKAEVQNQLNKKIKRIRSDKGGKYVLFNDFVLKKTLFMK